MTRVDIPTDLNSEDETGYVWTFLDEAEDPSVIVPGEVVVAGSPLTPDYATLAFARLAVRLGIGEIRLHDLRHFAATTMLLNGLDVRSAAGRLGHARASTTLDIYAHVTQPADQRASDTLAESLDTVSDPSRRSVRWWRRSSAREDRHLQERCSSLWSPMPARSCPRPSAVCAGERRGLAEAEA